jgi:hypothetical protein
MPQCYERYDGQIMRIRGTIDADRVLGRRLSSSASQGSAEDCNMSKSVVLLGEILA